MTMTSTASTTSVASMASSASVHQKNYWPWCFHQSWHQNGRSMWKESSKIHYFFEFWTSFRTEAVETGMLFLTKSKGQQSNVHCQWTCRYLLFNAFWVQRPCKCYLHHILSSMTLYVTVHSFFLICDIKSKYITNQFLIWSCTYERFGVLRQIYTWLKLPLVLPVSMVKQKTREQQNSINSIGTYFSTKALPMWKIWKPATRMNFHL